MPNCLAWNLPLPLCLASVQEPLVPPVYIAGGIYLAVIFAGFLVDFFLCFRFLSSPFGWKLPAERIRSRPWQARDALLLVLFLLLIQVLAGAAHWAAVKLGWLASGVRDMDAALVQGVMFHGVALLAVWMFIRCRRGSWQEAFGLDFRGLKSAVGQGLVAYVGIVPLVVATSLMSQIFFYAAGYPVTLQEVVNIFIESQSGWSLVLLVVLAVVVAPVVEETLFRGILLPVLMKYFCTGAAVAAVSLVFAGIHQHLPSFAPLFVLAVALSLLYIHSGSLWAPIVLHSIFNGVSICVIVLAAP